MVPRNTFIEKDRIVLLEDVEEDNEFAKIEEYLLIIAGKSKVKSLLDEKILLFDNKRVLFGSYFTKIRKKKYKNEGNDIFDVYSCKKRYETYYKIYELTRYFPIKGKLLNPLCEKIRKLYPYLPTAIQAEAANTSKSNFLRKLPKCLKRNIISRKKWNKAIDDVLNHHVSMKEAAIRCKVCKVSIMNYLKKSEKAGKILICLSILVMIFRVKNKM